MSATPEQTACLASLARAYCARDVILHRLILSPQLALPPPLLENEDESGRGGYKSSDHTNIDEEEDELERERAFLEHFCDTASPATYSRCARIGLRTLIMDMWTMYSLDQFAIDNEIRFVNIVMLGTGFDTRPWRVFAARDFPPQMELRVFEIDLPHVLEKKERYLKRYGISYSSSSQASDSTRRLEKAQVYPIPLDLFVQQEEGKEVSNKGNNQRSILQPLFSHPTFFSPSRATASLFIAEGVLMYLPQSVVKQMLAEIAERGGREGADVHLVLHLATAKGVAELRGGDSKKEKSSEALSNNNLEESPPSPSSLLDKMGNVDVKEGSDSLSNKNLKESTSSKDGNPVDEQMTAVEEEDAARFLRENGNFAVRDHRTYASAMEMVARVDSSLVTLLQGEVDKNWRGGETFFLWAAKERK